MEQAAQQAMARVLRTRQIARQVGITEHFRWQNGLYESMYDQMDAFCGRFGSDEFRTLKHIMDESTCVVCGLAAGTTDGMCERCHAVWWAQCKADTGVSDTVTDEDFDTAVSHQDHYVASVLLVARRARR